MEKKLAYILGFATMILIVSKEPLSVPTAYAVFVLGTVCGTLLAMKKYKN